MNRFLEDAMKQSLVIIILILGATLIVGCPIPGLSTTGPTTNDTDSNSIKTIDIYTILGIVEPVLDATPVTEISETSQYTGTVSWEPEVSGSFSTSTVYTATITLTPKQGFTLSGLAENSILVPGATTVNQNANSGVITAIFPATFGVSYTSVNIGSLKYVPAGRFQRDITPANISEISRPFRMSQYEITRSQFLAIMGTDPSNTTMLGGSFAPVQRVNWYHAIAFANKLSLAEELTPVYTVIVEGTPINWSSLNFSSIPITDNADWNGATANWDANGYRLPTEMEWMWAAMGAPIDGRGGNTNTTGYNKPFAGSTGSNLIWNYVWYRANSSSTQPVGSKQANELGLHDMSGNVLEWTWDRWALSYPLGILTDYRGPDTGNGRMTRGGHWDTDESRQTVAYRTTWGPGSSDYRLGFRVIRN